MSAQRVYVQSKGGNSENEIDSISYTRLAAVLIGAIKEQQIQINKLKEQIETNKK